MTLLRTVFTVRRVARQVFLGKDERIRRISVRNLHIVFLWHGMNFGHVRCQHQAHLEEDVLVGARLDWLLDGLGDGTPA